MNGLLLWIKSEVDFCRPTRLAQMMQLAQLTENQKIAHGEANLKGYAGGKYHLLYPLVLNLVEAPIRLIIRAALQFLSKLSL